MSARDRAQGTVARVGVERRHDELLVHNEGDPFHTADAAAAGAPPFSVSELKDAVATWEHALALSKRASEAELEAARACGDEAQFEVFTAAALKAHDDASVGGAELSCTVATRRVWFIARTLALSIKAFAARCAASAVVIDAAAAVRDGPPGLALAASRAVAASSGHFLSVTPSIPVNTPVSITPPDVPPRCEPADPLSTEECILEAQRRASEAAAKAGAAAFGEALQHGKHARREAHDTVTAVLAFLRHCGEDAYGEELFSRDAAQARRREAFHSGHFRQRLLVDGDERTRWAVSRRVQEMRGDAQKSSFCEWTGTPVSKCRCRSRRCGLHMICWITCTQRRFCDCGDDECGADLCECTDEHRNVCPCGGAGCGGTAATKSLVGITLTVTGDIAQLLRGFDRGGDQALVPSLKLKEVLAQRKLLQVIELRCTNDTSRNAQAAWLVREWIRGETRLALCAHGTADDDAVAGIGTHTFKLPQLADDATEDIMGVGVFASADLAVARKHTRSRSGSSAAGFTRRQRLVVLCIADLRGGNVITTNDPKYVQWPRKHETKAGTTARLQALGAVARQYYSGPGHPAGHELCVFDPARLVPVALGLLPRR